MRFTDGLLSLCLGAALVSGGFYGFTLYHRMMDEKISYLYQQVSSTLVSLQKSPQNLSTCMSSTCAQMQNPSAAVLTQVSLASSKKWVELQRKNKDAVIQVYATISEFNWIEPYRTPDYNEATGSGFFINNRGDFVTNYHVVGHSKNVQIQMPTQGQSRYDAVIIGVSPERDLALLALTDDARQELQQIYGTIPFVTLGDSDAISRGEEILALGYPLGMSHMKGSQGIVSGIERTKLLDNQLCFQMTAPINPGSSGGPCFNEEGQVIGVNFAGIQMAQNVGFVIPINDLKNALSDLYKVKFLRKPKLGGVFWPSSYDMSCYLQHPDDGGYYISRVMKDTLFEKIGIKSGDVLYQINGHKVDFYGDVTVSWNDEKVAFFDLLNRKTVGDSVDLVVYRQGAKKNFSFKLEPRSMLPIRLMFPGYEEIDYEVFGGIVFMNLTLNHICIMAEKIPALLRYASIDNQYKPAVVVTHVLPSSPAHRLRGTVQPGFILDEINGQKVATLEQLRQSVTKSLDSGFVTMKFEDDLLSVFALDTIMSDEHRLASIFKYKKSALVEMVETGLLSAGA